MGFNNIEKRSLWYTILKRFVVNVWHNFIFYRRVYVNHADRIPKSSNIIFTPNHQNALMDALGPLCTIKQQLVFLARSDIFNKKAIARILFFIKILPIFRIRDGYSEVKRNDAIFKKTVDVIKAHNGIVIFPEGNHIQKRILKPLKKGHARIAFQTAEANDFDLDLNIIAVGLNYSNYDDYRSELTINFGEPIPVADFFEMYQDSPAKAINKLNEEIATSLKTVIIEIDDDENYEMVDGLRELYKQRMLDRLGLKKNTSLNRFKAEKTIISTIKSINQSELDDIKSNYKLFISQLNRINVRVKDAPFKTKISNILAKLLIAIIAFPLFIYGLINSFIPFAVTEVLVKNVKDPSFVSSFRFVVSLALFLLFYIIVSIVLLFLISPLWIWILYVFSLPISAIIFFEYLRYIRRLYSDIRLYALKYSKTSEVNEMLKSQQTIFDLLDSADLKRDIY